MVESTAQTYDVSFEIKKHFQPNELTELVNAFKFYDTDKNGNMNVTEFKKLLVGLGKKEINDEQCKNMIAEHDLNKDGKI